MVRKLHYRKMPQGGDANNIWKGNCEYKKKVFQTERMAKAKLRETKHTLYKYEGQRANKSQTNANYEKEHGNNAGTWPMTTTIND